VAVKRKATPAAVQGGKRQQCCDQTSAMISDSPCEGCGNPEGDSMLVCEWCGAKSAHLACLGLAEVPDGVWCCSSCVEHKEEAQAADDLDGRWVLGKFQGGIFWGRLSSVGCYGLLSLR